MRQLSQDDLAKLLNTKQPAIARLESGRANPRLSTLVDLSKALEATVRIELTPTEHVASMGTRWWDATSTRGEAALTVVVLNDCRYYVQEKVAGAIWSGSAAQFTDVPIKDEKELPSLVPLPSRVSKQVPR